MTKKRHTLKHELEKIMKQRLEPEYLEKIGIGELAKKKPSVLRAIALAQVKKGLEGDLRAAEFIDELLCEETQTAEAAPFDVVVKVVGEGNGN
ncbi:MAG: hypothetical protein IJP38_09360 [Oscillospiraceae bacterium]|nr:hypothetical protein [Oscillospiraceae bacterium]